MAKTTKKMEWDKKDLIPAENIETGILSHFDYQLKMKMNVFEIKNREAWTDVYSAFELNDCILLHGHQVNRYHRGSADGLDLKTYNDWPKESQEVLAYSLGSVNKDGKSPLMFSPGNIVSNGYGHLIASSELCLSQIRTRFNFYFLCRDKKFITSGGDPNKVIVATTGYSTIKPFAKLWNTIVGEGLPGWSVLVNIGTVMEKSNSQKDYSKIVFTAVTDSQGNLKMSEETQEKLIKNIKPTSDLVRDLHFEEMRKIEKEDDRKMFSKKGMIDKQAIAGLLTAPAKGELEI